MRYKGVIRVYILIITAIMANVLAGCSIVDSRKTEAYKETVKELSENRKQETASNKEPVVLKLLLNSPELTEQYYDMAGEYNKSFPDVTLDMTILQNDYQTVLKTRLNAGDIPDIFITGAYNDNKVFSRYTYDLTDEDFVKSIEDFALKPVTLDGRITGYPFLLQAHSFIYNKKLFGDAGITELPKTKKELERVCAVLNSRGIQPFATGFGEWWVMEQIATQYMAPVRDIYGGDYSKLAEELNSGTRKFGDIEELSDVFDIIDLHMKFGGPRPRDTDFNTQCRLLAEGKAAMIHQGTWAEETIRKVNPNADIGFMAAPLGEKPANAGIMVDSNLCFRIYKESRQLKAALDWMRWIVTSDYGKHWVPEKCRQISTVRGAPIPDTQLAGETMEYIEKGKVYPWFKGYYVDGFEQQLGLLLQAYAAGNKTREQVREELTQAYKRLAK